MANEQPTPASNDEDETLSVLPTTNDVLTGTLSDTGSSTEDEDDTSDALTATTQITPVSQTVEEAPLPDATPQKNPKRHPAAGQCHHRHRSLERADRPEGADIISALAGNDSLFGVQAMMCWMAAVVQTACSRCRR